MVGWMKRMSSTRRRTPSHTTVWLFGGTSAGEAALVAQPAADADWGSFDEGMGAGDHVWGHLPWSASPVVIHAPRADAVNRSPGTSSSGEP